jgi:hypothetical protein
MTWARVASRVRTASAQPSPYCCRARIADVLEDHQRLPPGLAGLAHPPGGPQRVTQAVEVEAFEVPQAARTTDGQSLFEVVDRLVGPAEFAVGVAEHRHRPSLTPGVAGLPADDQRLLEVADRLVEPPEFAVGVTEHRQCPPLTPQLMRLATDLEGLLEMGGGVLVPREYAVGVAEVVQGPAFAVPVTQLPPDDQRLLEAVDSLLELPEVSVGWAEVVQHPAFPVPVVDLPCGGQPELVDADPVAPEFVGVEEVPQDRGNLPGDVVPAVPYGLPDRADQVREFGLTPRERLAAGAEPERNTVRSRRVEDHPEMRRRQCPRRLVGGVQVPVQLARDRRGPRLVAFLGIDALCGVHPQQVVHPVAIPPKLVGEVYSGQCAQHLPHPWKAGAGEGRCRVRADVLAAVQAQQPEEPGSRRGQGVIGPGEHDPHRAGHVARGGEQVEAALLLRQIAHQFRHTHVRSGRNPFTGDPQRERKVLTMPRQVANRFWLRVGTVAANRVPQQGVRLCRGEHVEHQSPGGVACDETRQPATAGHENQTRRRRR